MPKPSLDKLPQARRRRIIRACWVLFARHGYAGTSMKMIASRLRVADGHLYYYFTGKDDLVVWVIDQSADIWMEFITDHLPLNDNIPLFDLYRRTLAASVRFIAAYRHLYGMYFQFINEPHFPHTAYLAKKTKWLDGLYRNALENEIRMGRLCPMIPKEIVAMSLEVFRTRIEEFVYKPEIDPIGIAAFNEREFNRFADQIMGILQRGLAPASLDL
ncbi:MAG: TetR/AcrR family transcriptional regulator [Deltaproteobacteria bacterium]|nr:TetR/AcrR family transcriptional regulator [Deltaproteobacteria bacterium]